MVFNDPIPRNIDNSGERVGEGFITRKKETVKAKREEERLAEIAIQEMIESEIPSEREEGRKQKIKSVAEIFEGIYGEKWKEKSPGNRYTGDRFEEEILGEPDRETILNEANSMGLIDIGKFSDGKPKYIIKKSEGNLEKVFDLVKENQKRYTFEGEVKEKVFPAVLKESIAEKLGISADEADEYLKYYISTGTPLDHTGGFDCFFEISDKDGNMERISIDITLICEEDEKKYIKADVLMMEKDIWALHLMEFGINVDNFTKRDAAEERKINEIYELQTDFFAEKVANIYNLRRQPETDTQEFQKDN